VRNLSFLVLLAAAVCAAAVVTLLYRGNVLLSRGPEAERKVVVIFKTVDYHTTPFWGNVRDGVVSGSQDFGINVSIRGPAVESDISGQMEILRQAIDEKPDAIVLAAADYNLLVPLAGEIKRRGIPLVCIDSFINSDDVDVRIGTDSYEGGQKCGAALLRYVHHDETVAVMSYVKGSSTAIDRETGARDVLAGKVRLLGTQYSNADAKQAYAQAASLIAHTPELRGIVALNDPTAAGAARALSESGKAGAIALIGFDNSFAVLKYVERGIIRDSVVQKPFNMGYLGIKAARELIEGKKPPRFINTGSVDITRDNMFQPENQKLLFPVAEEPLGSGESSH
jgi:ribose transport system substrate-binding protein